MKSCNRILRAALVLLCFVMLTGSKANAQLNAGHINKYTYGTFTGTFDDISGSTLIVSGGDDNNSLVTLPFTFNFDSTDYTSVGACCNGYVVFGKTQNNWGTFVGTTTVAPSALIWSQDDWVNTGIYATTTGSSPHRVYEIEWVGIEFLSSYTNSTNMEMKLYEGTNRIEMIYSSHGLSMSSSNTAGVGINGNPKNFNYISAYGPSTSTPSSDYYFLPPALRPPSELALSTHSIDFGSLLTGEDSTQCITISSVGVGTLKFQSPSLGGNPDFSIVSGPVNNDTLQPGKSTSICVKFSPIASGTRTATLVIYSDGLDSGTQNISLTGFGIAPSIDVGGITSIFRKSKVPLGDTLRTTIPINSVGSGPLTINGISISGLNADQYAIAHYPATLLPKGTSDSLVILFVPTFEGRSDALITINSNAINAPVITIQPFGNGIIGHLVLSTQTVNFDSVAIGDSTCQNVTLTNTGTDTVRVLRNTLTSRDYDFTLTGLTGADTVIAPDQTKTITICFKPLQYGTRLATARIATNLPLTYTTPRVDTSQFVIQITGVGVPVGHLTFSGLELDSSIIGVSKCVPDTIRNNGGSDFTFTSASILGGDSSDFAFSGITFPFTLKPGEMVVANLCLTPSQRGPRGSTIVLTGTNNGKQQTVVLPLLGYGLQTCASATPLAIFGPTPTLIGTVDTQSVTVTNCGDVATTYTAALGSGSNGYSIVGPSVSATIPANGTATFQVTYVPTSIGNSAGTLNITGGPTPMSVALGGVGGGVMASSTTPGGGEVMVTDCQQFDVTITNSGNVNWTPGTATISGPNQGDFTIVSGPTPSTIAPNGTAVVTIKYCPNAVGPSTATLTFPNGTPTPVSGYSQNLTGTGIPAAGVQSVSKEGFVLGQSYPNPMSLKASISFTLPTSAAVRMDIVDQKGNLVKAVAEGRYSAGANSVSFDASDLASGTYFYVLTSGDVRLARQLVIVK